jgi:hypothetical protein
VGGHCLIGKVQGMSHPCRIFYQSQPTTVNQTTTRANAVLPPNALLSRTRALRRCQRSKLRQLHRPGDLNRTGPNRLTALRLARQAQSRKRARASEGRRLTRGSRSKLVALSTIALVKPARIPGSGALMALVVAAINCASCPDPWGNVGSCFHRRENTRHTERADVPFVRRWRHRCVSGISPSTPPTHTHKHAHGQGHLACTAPRHALAGRGKARAHLTRFFICLRAFPCMLSSRKRPGRILGNCLILPTTLRSLA